MKRFLIPLLFLITLAGTLCAFQNFAFQNFSRVASVEPDTGKVGDEASAKGENLAKSKIGELYLTDGKNDVKAAIIEQSDTEIKFKIPKIEPGRYRLMLVTAKKDSMIEQPVVITVE
jgi:hypothetical protein